MRTASVWPGIPATTNKDAGDINDPSKNSTEGFMHQIQTTSPREKPTSRGRPENRPLGKGVQVPKKTKCVKKAKISVLNRFLYLSQRFE
jgi:hypothetical protein